MSTVLHGRFTPDDKAAGDYALLPFEVPAGTRRIEVRFAYDRRPETVLDLGLFDPRGSDFLTPDGFRGWSGGARDHVVLTDRGATPGYLPGPILPGRWQILLGLYKLAPAGCDYRIEIICSPEGGDLPWPPPGEPATYTPRQGPAWFKGDLQSHTHHSDASGTVDDLATAAARHGLDFVAVTDHNTVSHHPYLRARSTSDLLLIPGEEVTTYYGHANVWGLDRWIDFRCRHDHQIEQVVDTAHRQGALISINHPKREPPWTYSTTHDVDCIEVWHAFWSPGSEDVLALWEEMLRAGRRVVAVGGSDRHQVALPEGDDPLRLGRPTTHVYAEALTCEAILDAVRAGRVFITADVDMPQLYLEAGTGDRTAMIGDQLAQPGDVTVRCRVTGGEDYLIRLLGADGEIGWAPVQEADEWFEWTVDLATHRYVRAELRSRPLVAGDPRDRQMLIALTNPIFGPR